MNFGKVAVLLGGKSADIRDAENAHRDAIRAAGDKVKDILRRAGQTATPATLTAVAETLEALPAADKPGRLTKPLKRMGFEALAGVPLQVSAAARHPRDPARAPLTIVPKRDDPQEKERQRQALKEQREAEAAVKRAQAAVEKAQQDVSRKEAALAAAVKERERLRKELADAISEHQRATLRVRK